jgi:hypothetical protein
VDVEHTSVKHASFVHRTWTSDSQRRFDVETLAKLSPCMTVSTNECLLRELCYSWQRILGWDRSKYPQFLFSFSAAIVTQLQLRRLPCLVSVESVGHLPWQETYVLQVPVSGRSCFFCQIAGLFRHGKYNVFVDT